MTEEQLKTTDLKVKLSNCNKWMKAAANEFEWWKATSCMHYAHRWCKHEACICLHTNARCVSICTHNVYARCVWSMIRVKVNVWGIGGNASKQLDWYESDWIELDEMNVNQ